MFLSAGLAWLVIPRTWAHFSVGSLDFQSWRLFVVLCSVPSLTSALLFRLLMPESPKFLMEVFKGLRMLLWIVFYCLLSCLLRFFSHLCQAAREKEAIRVFQVMFELNMWGKGKDFPV